MQAYYCNNSIIRSVIRASIMYNAKATLVVLLAAQTTEAQCRIKTRCSTGGDA